MSRRKGSGRREFSHGGAPISGITSTHASAGSGRRSVVLLTFFLVPCTASGQGLVLPSVGPVNRSMAGASTAAPIDPTGAIHWNPASISGLDSSQMDLGLELLYPSLAKVSSTVGMDALGPGVPPVTLSGSTGSDRALYPLPTVALILKPDESRWTFGVGVFTIGGTGADLPQDNSNPIFTPPPPNGIGVGSVYSRVSILQTALTASFQLTETVSIGLAPTISVADISVEPFTFAAPDDANGDGFPTYPSGTSSAPRFGGGVQAGIYYKSDFGLGLGAAIKSPQWFETFTYNSEDELGFKRTLRADFEYPMILSFGVAWTGFERWTIATDVRYVDYDNAEGFEGSGFDSDGSLRGLGWESVFFVGVGVQYQLTDSLALRVGYSYNENPIPDSATSVNLASPAIYEHAVYAGVSYEFMENWSLSVAYLHAFENSIRGRIVTPLGPVPGTSVKVEAATDALLIGLNVKWGG